jgi:polysaccharide biosynthesis protein PslE
VTNPPLIQSDPDSPRVIWNEIIRILHARMFRIAMVFLATVGAAYIYLQFVSDQYEAEAGLLVRLGRENVETPVTVAKGIVNTIGVREEEVNSNIQLLASPSLIDAVVDRIGVEAFEFEAPPPKTLIQKIKYHARNGYRWGRRQIKEALIALNLKKGLTKRDDVLELARRSLTVERVKTSDVIRVRMRLPDPGLAVRFVDVLLKLYLQRHVLVHQDANVTGFFTAEVRDHQASLKDIDRRLILLRDAAGVSAVDHQRELLLDRLDDLQEKIEDAENERAMVDRSPAAAGRPSALPPAIPKAVAGLIPNPSVDSLKEKLTERHLERVSIAESNTAESLSMKRLETEITVLEDLLLRGLDERLGQLKARARAIEEQLRALNTSEAQLDQLKREKNVEEQNYYVYTKRMEEARINDELDRGSVANISILYPPGATIEPVAPRKMLIMYISLAVGAVLGLALALVPEYFNDTIRTDRDVMAIDGVTFLGSFRLPRARRRQGRARATPGAVSPAVRPRLMPTGRPKD